MKFDDVLKPLFAEIPGIAFATEAVMDGVRIFAHFDDARGVEHTIWSTHVDTERVVRAMRHDLAQEAVERPIKALRAVISSHEAKAFDAGLKAGRSAAIEELRHAASLMRELKV